MGHRKAAEGYRVLILAPFGRDAASMASLLGGREYSVQVCRDLRDLAARLDQDAGVVLVTEEALKGDLGGLSEGLTAQPPWSDIPVLLLAARHHERQAAASDQIRLRLAAVAGNLIVLDRPLGLTSLVSSIAAAMRARQKQFEMRDRLRDLDDARAELAENEAQLRLATDAGDVGLWDVDPIHRTLYWAPRVRELFGVAPDIPIAFEDFVAGLHPDDAEATLAAFAAAGDPARRTIYDVEYRVIARDNGEVRWLAARGRGVFDEAGRCIRLLGVVVDITSKKAAELALRTLNETLEERVSERTQKLMSAEEALRQSQKMEAVGQLTGGIAHDFNNMLTGVIGSLDMMKRRLSAGRTDGLERFMETAQVSAQRAAGLTARLLAFSRRQSLDEKPLDVDALVQSLQELLRRTLTEKISLAIVAGQDVPAALADANQLESAIVNLAINARDAMPDGGKLTVETRAVDLDAGYAERVPHIEPGRYVVIAVTDTGVGMTPDILEKVFDPFFTTKPIGQGTGLGLSMVYGFVRQSGGQVRVHSKPGVGTTVSIYLRATETAQAAGDTSHTVVAPEGQGQTVLVVEDEAGVRLLVREVLEELAYVAVEAADANEAIQLLTSPRSIDLMISDVGLPGMNGRQLAEVARRHRPDLPILFVTGYAENAAIRSGFLGTNMQMITKPFALEALAEKVSDMMGGRPPDARPPAKP